MVKLYYVRHERVGGVIVEAKSRAAAMAAVNFGGHVGSIICRRAKVSDRAWWYGQLKYGDYYAAFDPIVPRERFLRRSLSIGTSVTVYSWHPHA